MHRQQWRQNEMVACGSLLPGCQLSWIDDASEVARRQKRRGTRLTTCRQRGQQLLTQSGAWGPAPSALVFTPRGRWRRLVTPAAGPGHGTKAAAFAAALRVRARSLACDEQCTAPYIEVMGE